MKTKDQPSPEQMKALRAFAKANGRNWKDALSTLWLNGGTTGYLQQIRNQFGPRWLYNFRLKGEETPVSKPASREEQHGTYLDSGPQAWDDRDNPDY